MSLDPAKLHDYSALSVIRVSRESGGGFNKYKLIALERQRRQPYDITAAWFKKAFLNPMLREGVTFQPIPLIDIGGVGEPTADIIKRMGVKVRGLRYTAGDGFRIDERRTVNVSKVLMISTFLGVVDGDRFTMPPQASFESLFKGELRAFRGALGNLGRMKFEAEEGKTDDLVCSVAQSVWFAEAFIKPRRHLQPPPVAAFNSNEIDRMAEAGYGEPHVGLSWDMSAQARAEGEQRRLQREKEEKERLAREQA